MEWKTVKLGDVSNVQTGPFGSQLHNEDYVLKGTPIVTVEHLGARVFSTQNLPCVSDADKERLKKYSLKEGDVVFSRVGSVDRCSYVSSNEDGWLFSGRCLRVRANEIIYPMFLYYYLKKEDVKQSIRNIAVGATMPSINTKLLSEIKVSYPPLEDQLRIAAILSSLDDKIENNNRINRNLEAQAHALFKSWFVDFEPWDGIMPEDWKVGTLGEICKQLKERVGERDDVKVLSPVTTGKLMLSEEYFTKQVFSQSIAKYIIVPPTSFAYNPARVNIGSLGMNEYDFDGCVSPVYVVFECLDGYEYYFDLFRQTNMFKEEVKLRAIGGVRQSLNYEDFARITCNIPSKDAIEKFNTIYLANLDARNHNSKENKRLATLRDTLLPKLMRGEISL